MSPAVPETRRTRGTQAHHDDERRAASDAAMGVTRTGEQGVKRWLAITSQQRERLRRRGNSWTP